MTAALIRGLVALCFCGFPAAAGAQAAAAKPPQPCMMPAELEAEAIVRTGIVLRAYARECARRGIDGSILQKWSAFDAANAQNLRDAVQQRTDAFARGYPDNPYAGQQVIDDTLASRGLTALSAQECIATAAVVDRLEVWDDLVAHARRTELGKVKTAIRTCRPGPAPAGQ